MYIRLVIVYSIDSYKLSNKGTKEMKHLQAFEDWKKKGICQLKSLKQFRFFQWQLNQAVKIHPHKVEKCWNNCYGFYNETDELILTVELKNNGQGQLFVD